MPRLTPENIDRQAAQAEASMPPRTPAPDAVAVALDNACETCFDCRRYTLTGGCAGCTNSFAAARARYAAMVKALADAEALLARVADEAASTQNTARRTEGQMPLIDCRLIADVFRYVGERKVQP